MTRRPNMWNKLKRPGELETTTKVGTSVGNISECRKYLQGLLKPGDTVYLVSRYRPYATIAADVYVWKDKRPVRVTEECARVLNWQYNLKSQTLSIPYTPADPALESSPVSGGKYFAYNLSYRLFEEPNALFYEWM